MGSGDSYSGRGPHGVEKVRGQRPKRLVEIGDGVGDETQPLIWEHHNLTQGHIGLHLDKVKGSAV